MNGEPKTGLSTISLGRPWCVRRVSAGPTERRRRRRRRRIWQEPAVTISTYYPIIYPEEIGKITKILSEFVWGACFDSNLGHHATSQEILAVITWSMIVCFHWDIDT
jgi:hypothetical protein